MAQNCLLWGLMSTFGVKVNGGRLGVDLHWETGDPPLQMLDKKCGVWFCPPPGFSPVHTVKNQHNYTA